MSPSNIDIVTLIARVQNILDLVVAKGSYVIIVCPNTEMATKTARIVGTLVSEIGKFSGRSVVFSNKGELSVVCADDEDFIPNKFFEVEFVGWSVKDDKQGMLKWQNKASV